LGHVKQSGERLGEHVNDPFQQLTRLNGWDPANRSTIIQLAGTKENALFIKTWESVYINSGKCANCKMEVAEVVSHINRANLTS